jgi:hypothetical protein
MVGVFREANTESSCGERENKDFGFLKNMRPRPKGGALANRGVKTLRHSLHQVELLPSP